MLLFLDNDILLKIGSLGFLEDLKNLFNTDISSIYILPSAKFYISNNKELRHKYSESTLEEIVSILENYNLIPDKFIDDMRYQSLANIDKIDSGERVLFSINPSIKEFLILTGDKNSIIHLAKQKSIEDIISSLAGKIICLEYVMIKLLDLHGIDFIQRRIKERNFGGDKTLNLVFDQPNINLERAKEGLTSYYNNLFTQSGQLLRPL